MMVSGCTHDVKCIVFPFKGTKVQEFFLGKVDQEKSKKEDAGPQPIPEPPTSEQAKAAPKKVETHTHAYPYKAMLLFPIDMLRSW